MVDEKEINVIWQPNPGAQDLFLQCPIFEILLEGPRGTGKRILNSESILTDSGWKRVDAISYRDELVAIDGTYTRITGIFPSDVADIYEVSFDDGGKVCVDNEHLWSIYSSKNGKRDGWQVKPTSFLANTKQPYYIPLITSPVPGKRWHGCDPYVFGCCKEKDKQVPNELLLADSHARLRLLQGLMDSDGICNKEGKCSFVSISNNLAKSVQYLVRSLGGKASLHIKYKKLSKGEQVMYYYVKVMHCNKFNPFTLSKKANRVKKMTVCKRRIVKVRKVENGAATCFAVEHVSKLFVVQDFIVTHNTDALLMKYAKNVGKGYGAEWRGIIFRETYKNLEDIKNKSLKWFKQIFPKAVFNISDYKWTFPGGETLYFSYARTKEDYWNYHGHAYPFIGWEELTNWRDSELYLMMFSICRSSHPDIPQMIASTCNPWGKGHNWIKKRFKISEVKSCAVIEDKTKSEITGKELVRERCYIHSNLSENLEFVKNNPDYEANLAQNANPNQKKAWIEGSWDIVAGGMFDDLWDKDVHILPRINIPNSWYIDRSFDWGQSKPFSVGWWAMTDGTPIDILYKIRQIDGSYIDKVGQKTFPKGTLIRFWEWYGCQPDTENKGLRLTSKEIGRGIQKMEKSIKKVFNIVKINAGPGDSSIFNADHANDSIAELINEGYGNTRQNHIFVEADKAPGSRKRHWEKMRILFKDSLEFPMENPGLFVTEDCKAFIRTVPVLSRDVKDPDDINCFVAGTKVQTEKGIKKIENVTIEDLVYTPIGLMPVLKSINSGMSKTVRLALSNGETLEGTAKHKIYVPGKGLIRLDEIIIGDELESVLNRMPDLVSEKQMISMNVYDLLYHFSIDIFEFCMEYFDSSNVRKSIISILDKLKKNSKYKDAVERAIIDVYSHLIPSIKIETSKIKVLSIEYGAVKKDVYNLVTAKAHLYYANGILVSNTDEEDHCVVGSTLVCTDKGKIPIKDLVGTEGKVLTDEGYQKYRSCRKLGINKEVIQLLFDNGDNVICTPDHKFYTNNGWIEAQHIKEYTCYVYKEDFIEISTHLINIETVPNEDVYCLTVPDYGRFCIESGIIIANCADEAGYRCIHQPQIRGSIKHRIG